MNNSQTISRLPSLSVFFIHTHFERTTFLVEILESALFYVVSFMSTIETNHMPPISIMLLLISVMFLLKFVSFLLYFHIILSHCQTSFTNQIHFRIYYVQFTHMRLNLNLQVCLKLFKCIIVCWIQHLLPIFILRLRKFW
jgi:hypothetical protein